MEDFLRFSFLVLSFEASLQRNDCVFILSVERKILEHIASSDACCYSSSHFLLAALCLWSVDCSC